MKEELTFNSGGLKLAGTLYKANPERAGVLFIAGGGNIPRKESYYTALQEGLVESGVTSFNFDFRGVGEAEGRLDESSLNTRVEDAKSALEALKENCDTDKIYLVGGSMGAPVAINIMNLEVTGLLLFAPAAYSMEARDKNFGPAFSEAIRKTESWKNSPDFERLKEFGGKTLLLYGTKDEVIPHEILNTYSEIVNSKGGEIVLLKDATHSSWKSEQRSQVLDKMIHFIKWKKKLHKSRR